MAWFNTANLAVSVPSQGIYLVHSEEKELWQISKEDSGSSWNWSPDGKKLALDNLQGQITIYDMETGSKTQLTLKGFLAWHPGGKVLAIGNSANLFLVNALDGNKIAQLTLGSPGWSGKVSFDPDGTRLAFLGDFLYIVDLTFSTDGEPIGFGLYQEISTKAAEMGVTEIIQVSWSPAGDRLAVIDMNWPKDPYVVIISPEGILRSMVTVPYIWLIPDFSWSPDGAYLAVMTSSIQYSSRIYVVNYKGTGPVMIDDTSGTNCMSWTSDSNRLIYTKISLDLPSKIMISDAAGIQKQMLTISQGIKGDMITICAKPRPGYAIEAVPIPTLTPDPRCTTWSQLKAGMSAKVIDTTPNRVRYAPQKGDNLIGSLAPQSVVKVLEGPICSDGLVFWKVESNSIPGGWGWTAEGDGITYWMAPYTP